MDLFKIILLSIVQGITEILPISSSGHLILFKYLLNIKSESLTLEIFLHIGSLFAVFFYYRKEIKEILLGTIKYIFKIEPKTNKNYFKLFLLLVLSTFITGIGGLLLNSLVKNTLSNITLLPFFFLFTSLTLFLSKKINNNTKELTDITILDALIIGLFQLIGIIPGISRSGITIVGCKTVKLNNYSSFKYSYLLFIPITFASFILELSDLLTNSISLTYPTYYYLIGIAFSSLFTYFSIILVKKVIIHNKINYFSFYLIFISLLTILCTNYL